MEETKIVELKMADWEFICDMLKLIHDSEKPLTILPQLVCDDLIKKIQRQIKEQN